MVQVLQQGIRRRKDSDPTSKGETFQMSHLSQEAVHWAGIVNTLHAGTSAQPYRVGSVPTAHGQCARPF